MKTHTIAAAILGAAAISGSAWAADIAPAAPAPVYQPPPVVTSAYNWSGFYIGANAGWGWASSSGTATINSPVVGIVTGSSSGNVSGAIAGGQIGANWQSGMFVFGGEIDAQWSDQTNTNTLGCGAGCTLTETGKIDSFGTARVRLGAAFDRVLVYGTGGAAWTHVTDTINASGFGVTVNFLNASGSQFGWTVGVGAEMALFGNLTAKAEYLYISTNNITVTGTIPALFGGGTATTSGDIKDNIFRLGLNYKFGGGPVVARY